MTKTRPKVRSSEWGLAGPVRTAASASTSDVPPKPPTVWNYPRLSGFTRVEARKRRTEGYDVEYGAGFDVVSEVREQLAPLAVQVSALQELIRADLNDGTGAQADLPGWRFVRGEVSAVASAVHELWQEMCRALIEGGGMSIEGRASVSDVALDGPPALSDEDIASGAWAELLVTRVPPLNAEFSVLLGSSPAAAGHMSATSYKLHSALHPLDRAALALANKIPKVRAAAQFQAEAQAAKVARERDQARERERQALARVGL